MIICLMLDVSELTISLDPGVMMVEQKQNNSYLLTPHPGPQQEQHDKAGLCVTPVITRK